MLIEEICESIRTAIKNSKEEKSSKIWTQNLNVSLCKLAQNYGFAVYTKNIKAADWGEWLYDFVCCEVKNEEILRTVFVMESEWLSSDEEVLIDFNKLLLCNSEIKIMVYYNKDDDEIKVCEKIDIVLSNEQIELLYNLCKKQNAKMQLNGKKSKNYRNIDDEAAVEVIDFYNSS